MDDYIQINRINTQAIPGPNFAPGVTIYGGGLVAPVGGWVKPVEEPFPRPEEPLEERPDAGFHPGRAFPRCRPGCCATLRNAERRGQLQEPDEEGRRQRRHVRGHPRRRRGRQQRGGGEVAPRS